MKTLEIYFSDLNEKMQEEIYRFFGYTEEEGDNFDIIPLFILEYDEEDGE